VVGRLWWAGGPDLIGGTGRPARPRCPVTAAQGSAPRSQGGSSPRRAFLCSI